MSALGKGNNGGNTREDDNNTRHPVIVGPDLNATRTPFDKKHYRQILLPNGLRAVLVSDVVAMTQAYNSGGLYDEQDDDGDISEDDDDHDDHDDGDHGEKDDDSDASSDAQHGLRNAAAAMIVGTGSLYDPPECQGMAHFLEHLLFMGSKKYPEENSYDKFMSQHGGDDNAYTEAENTVYHFEIPQEYLAGALDIFAQFFIHPLMLESSVERELNAIESEFQLVKNSDATRMDNLMQYTCGRTFEEHPFSKFGWGNYKSLKTIPQETKHDPMKLLREFYDQHYYASNMRLVVVGGYTLDYLQDHVVKCFSDVRSKDALGSYTWNDTCQSPIRQYGLPLADSSLEKIFYVVPVRDRHYLCVTWQIPSQIENWRSKPCDYLGHLIGHEGKGSLLASLKSKSWVTACSAGVGDDGEENASSHALFQVSFTLSEEGVEHWREVISELYKYVGMLRYHCLKGLPAWIFEELQNIGSVAHKYADEPSPEDFAVDLADELSPWWNTPPERLLDASGLYFEYKADIIRSLLDGYLKPSNARIDVSSTRFGRSGEYEDDEASKKLEYHSFFAPIENCLPPSDDLLDPSKAGPPNIEPIFGTPFWCQSVSTQQLQAWTAHAEPQLPTEESMIALPLPNEFIPNDFDLKPLPADDCDHPLLNCSIKLQIPVGKRREWFPATVTKFNSTKNQILCHYEDEHERWHQMDVPACELQPNKLTSPEFEGTLDKAKVKYRIVSVAMDGEKATMKFGDESDFDVEAGKSFPAIPPAASPSRLPKLVSNTTELKFWHLQDRTFKRPVAELRLCLYCAEANKSALHSACADILVNLVCDNLTEVAYTASICDLGSSVSATDDGFSLRVHGFDDKLPKLFTILLESLLKFRQKDLAELPAGFTLQRFDLIMEKYQRALHNSGMKSSKLGSSARVRCLVPGSYSSHQKLKAIEGLSITVFLATLSSTLCKIGAEGLYHGNVDRAGAESTKCEILKLLQSSYCGEGSGGLAKKKYPSQLVTNLPGKTCMLTLPAKDPTETNAAVEIYFQVGKDSTRDRVMVDLLMEILNEPMYNQIRTLDQFGYHVSCDARWTNGIIGMHFSVVTPSKTAQETVDRIERFLLEYRQVLADMSQNDFMEHMVGLAMDKLNMFHSLSEETSHFWSEIRDGRYKWEVEREDVICLKSMTKEQALEAYDKWISPANKKRRMIVVKVVANEGPAAEGRPDVKPEEAESFTDRCVEETHSFCKNQTYGRVY